MNRKEQNAKYYQAKKIKKNEPNVHEELQNEIQVLKHKIELLELTIQHKNEIISILKSVPVNPVPMPVNPMPIVPVMPIVPMPIVFKKHPKDKLFRHCLSIESNCNSKQDFLKFGYFEDELSEHQSDINNFITCKQSNEKWIYDNDFNIYKIETMGNNSYQEMVDIAKHNCNLIIKEKNYDCESQEKIHQIIVKMDKKVENFDGPIVFCPEHYVSLRLGDMLNNLIL